MAVVLSASRSASAIQNLKVGDTLPAFSLPRADGTTDTYNAEALKGRPAAVVFWRPGQKLSLEALRDLQAIAQEIGDSKIWILAVDTSRASAQQVQSALADERLSFPVVLDPQRDLYGKVGVIVSPTTLLLDAEGVLRFVMASHPRQFRQVVRARLRNLLGEIDDAEMTKEIEPTVLKITHDVAAAWRMYNLGRRLQAEGRAAEALAVYEKAASEHASFPEVRCALGFMKIETGDLAAAARHFQAALAYQPASPTARLGQAAVLARTGRAAAAEQTLLSLLGYQSIAARVRYELGRLYEAQHQLDKAVTYYHDALTILFPEAQAGSTRPSSTQVASTASSRAGAVAPGPISSAAVTPAAKKPIQTIEAVTPPEGARYIGVKKCKKCHLQQWKSWKDTKMAAAFALLKPGVRAEAKAARTLDPQKDYTKDAQCLRCHSNGFRHPGGYDIPPAGDARAARAARANACVGCESCHGPGSRYQAIHKEVQDKQRPYKQAELYAAGQYRVDIHVCAACHGGRAPCVAPGTAFDYEKRKQQGTHKHYELRFRSR